jgi:hypothetical protein
LEIYTIRGRLIKSKDQGTVSQGSYSVLLNLGNALTGTDIAKPESRQPVIFKESG